VWEGPSYLIVHVGVAASVGQEGPFEGASKKAAKKSKRNGRAQREDGESCSCNVGGGPSGRVQKGIDVRTIKEPRFQFSSLATNE